MSKVGQHNWEAHGIPHMQAPVTLANGSTSHTCPPALGYSFAAGTTDGPGEFDFTQGVITGNPFWDFISGLLQEPSPEQVECQAPKPILLDTGEYVLPFAWHPIHIDTQVRKISGQGAAQVLRIGQVLLLAVPGEFTTMAGRWRRAALFSQQLCCFFSGDFGNPLQRQQALKEVRLWLPDCRTRTHTTSPPGRNIRSKGTSSCKSLQLSTVQIRGRFHYLWTSHSPCIHPAV